MKKMCFWRQVTPSRNKCACVYEKDNFLAIGHSSEVATYAQKAALDLLDLLVMSKGNSIRQVQDRMRRQPHRTYRIYKLRRKEAQYGSLMAQKAALDL